MPKISVILPVFNTQDFLKNSIESCLKQSLSDIEIIIIDDKSTDSSLKIIESYKDERIKIIKNKENLGTFLSRNEGIKIANGEYIIFLDGDDYLENESLEILYDLAVSKSADMVNFGIINKPIIKNATLPKIHTEEILGEEITNQIIIKDFKKSWFIVCARLFKTALVKNAIKQLAFIDRHLISSEDSILFFVICLLAKKSVGVKKNFYIYCQNDGSIMRSINKEKLLKQIDDRTYLKNALDYLSQNKDLSSHKYFHQAKKNMQNMLDYFICYSKRFLTKSDLNTTISPYFTYSIMSFKFMARWQIAVKLMIFILTFGTKKL